jgi:HSP20 family molecular chaperone IbpA
MTALQKLDFTISPRVDVFENEDAYLLLTDLPDVQADDVSLSYENRHLDLAAINHTQAIRYARRFHIGDIDQENIVAKLNAGVLSLQLPKVALAKPTKVKVTAA